MTEILLTDEMKKRSVANYGNPYRILKMFEKLKRGEEITFVTIGGSITQRYNASSPELCYAALLAKELENSFPEAKINYINAGIGATGSLIGVHRLKRDVLVYNPDFVTVEFSVNEGNCDDTVEYYDNLIFNILNYSTKPAVLCLGMVNHTGSSAQESHIKVARHYDLPFISYRDAVWPEIVAGRLSWNDLSDDIIHPHDGGHQLTTRLIIDYFEGIYGKSSCDFSDNKCDKALISNRFRNAQIYYIDDITPELCGCFVREKVNLNKIPYGWLAHENGAPIVFNLKKCSRVYMLFERTNKGDGGKAIARVFDWETVLDADFKDGWGIYYNNSLVYSGDEAQDIILSITPELENGKHFAVAGIMVS